MSFTPNRTRPSQAVLLAPPWHTAALVSLMLVVAATGTWLSRRAPGPMAPFSGSPVLAVYLPTIAVQWALTLYVSRIGLGRNALPRWLGRPWDSPTRAGVDMALAAMAYVLIEVSEAWWARHHASARSAAALAMLPHSAGERALWVILAASAGFCEEVVYRGYLQTQLTAWTGAVAVGITLQAVLFGVAHLEQGLAAGTRFALYGCAFGALARWRRSLWPGIACHAGLDLTSGLLGR